MCALGGPARTRFWCVLGTGPSLMAYEERNRTPGVSFGDKFVVAVQFVLIKEGPEKVGV